MNSGQPITTAVYGSKRGGKKPARKEQPRRAERLVGRVLRTSVRGGRSVSHGEAAIADVYDRLGFKRPEDRRRRGGRR